MAIGFRAITQIASGGATDPTSAPALPTGTASGDLVVYFVIVKYASTTITPPADWMDPANNEAANSGLTDSGNDAGNIRAAVFFRQYDGVWSMPTIDLSGTPNCTMVGAVSYTKGAAEVWDVPTCASAADDTVAAAGVDPGVTGTTIPLASGDWLGSFAAQNGDVGTFASHNIAISGITFGTQNTRLGAATSSGTDLRGHSIDRPYSSGTSGGGVDGSMLLTTGGASTAGVMVFFKLSLGVTAVLAAPMGSLTATASATVSAGAVQAVLAAPLGALSGTVTATPTHLAVLAAPLGALTATATATTTRSAVLAAPLGGLTATAAAAPTRSAVLAAPLGALSAAGTAVPNHPAVLAAGLGVLAAAITATPDHPATLAAPLGALTASASATVTGGSNTVSAVLLAALGTLTAAASATPEHPVTAVAACGGLTATAGATVRHSAVGAAPLGELVATATATATSPPVVTAVLVSDLGALVAIANAGPPPPPVASVGFARFDVPSPAWGEVISWVDYLNEPMWEDFYI